MQVGTVVCQGRVIIPVRAIVITIFKLNFCLIYLEKYDVNDDDKRLRQIMFGRRTREEGARERDKTCHYTEKPLKSVLFKHCFIVFRNYGYNREWVFGLTKDEKWVPKTVRKRKTVEG